MLWRVPILHRRVHPADECTHIYTSTEVADADVAPIQKISRRKYIPNDEDRYSPIYLAWDTQIHERSRHGGADGCATWKDASSHVPRGCRWKHCCLRGGETRASGRSLAQESGVRQRKRRHDQTRARIRAIGAR